jgi:VCBS repeat-containing protein
LDDTATTHEDIAITIPVLGNDTDADKEQLTIISVHQDAGAHGTVTIAADGKSIIYTPDQNYAGSNSDPNSVDATFQYAVSDGHGGQDSATVNLHIVPVADQPTVSYAVLTPHADDPINMVRLKVTATASDGDGSEFIDRIEFAKPPDGFTLITNDDLNYTGIGVVGMKSVYKKIRRSQTCAFHISLAIRRPRVQAIVAGGNI